MTDDDKELVECKACANLTPDMEQSAARTAAQVGGVMHCRECGRVYETCAALIRTLTAENARLNTLINETGDHWLALQNDHPIIWEGAIDAAMKAACDEIRRLRGITKPDPLVEAVKDILDEDSLHNAEEFSEAIRAALAKRGLEIREKE